MSPEEFAAAYNVSRETISRLQIYFDLLVKWQKAVNLVSPKSLPESWSRHFADSAQLANHISPNSEIVDLGSGAGFPGMVLAIMRPDLKIHLVESDGKKCEFLKNVSRETKASVTIHNERAEKILGQFEPAIITARAFAPLVKILSMIPPGKAWQFLLLKGKGAAEEIAASQKIYDFSCEKIPGGMGGEGVILKIGNLHKLQKQP